MTVYRRQYEFSPFQRSGSSAADCRMTASVSPDESATFDLHVDSATIQCQLCVPSDWFQLPIRQATPQPFQRPELEVTQPNRRDHDLEYPNCYDNAELPSARHFAEQSETVPVED